MHTADAASEALRIASLTGADDAEIRRLEARLRAAQNALFAAAKKAAEAARAAR